MTSQIILRGYVSYLVGLWLWVK